MDRNDNTDLFVLKTILMNNRLDIYKEYITYAKNCGYHVCGLEEFYSKRQSNGKFFILRHDVDIVTPGTYQMYLAEKESGVHSTYYFRNCTLDTKLINMMINDGFEVGFHYETLANYAMSRNTTALNSDDIEAARSLLKDEIKDFEKRINHKIVSVASHGHPVNGVIGYSNNYLLEGQNNEDYGILFEAYDSDMYREYVKIHIMDGPVWMNYGFAYLDNPIDAINNGAEVIVLLAHPNHWYGNKLRQIKDLARFFLGTGKKYKVREFKRIAMK